MRVIRLAPFASAAILIAGMTAASATPLPIGASPMTGLRDLGRATASTRVNIAVILNYHNEDALDRLVDAQADPDSPLFHHFLTSKQFNASFAATSGEYAHVATVLRRAGFTVTHTFDNRTVLDASASAPVAERFFGVQIHRVVQPGVGTRYVNVTAGRVPSSIANETMGVLGLESLHLMHPNIRFLPPGAARPVRPNISRDAAPLFGPDGGYGPQVYINSYALPASKGFTGSGRSSGVATDADFVDSDLAGYLSYFQVTRTGPATQRVLVDGGPPAGYSSESDETQLDVSTIVSIAPATALYVYEGPFSSTLSNFIDIFNTAVNQNVVDQLNSSYSECETAFIPTFPMAAEAVEKQGSALGITFHASTGDGGSDTYGCNFTSIGTPTDTPHNVAIGGTTMQVDHSTGNETSEVTWGGTGGGVSVVFTKVPRFQKRVQNVITTGRNIPDVSFDADPNTGEAFYFQGRFEGPIGGTSLSSPIFGASITEINQMLGSRSGWFTKTMYKVWKKHGYGSGTNLFFRDIVTGSNGAFSAKTGYDQVTGIGAMLVNNFSSLL